MLTAAALTSLAQLYGNGFNGSLPSTLGLATSLSSIHFSVNKVLRVWTTAECWSGHVMDRSAPVHI